VIRQADNNTYTQIGLVLLVALASKNAILIVEFASQERANGLGIREAAKKAATLRFRAILMTAISSILGFLPLLFATGAGAASRHAVGNALVGGMIAATFFSLLFVPTFFMMFQRLSEWGGKKSIEQMPLQTAAEPELALETLASPTTEPSATETPKTEATQPDPPDRADS